MAAPRNSSDPRLGAPSPAEEGVLPVVALPREGLPRWLLVAMAALAAIILFVVLDARRRAVTTPPETAASPQAVASAPPPPLYVPVPPPPQAVAQTPIILIPQTPAPRAAPAPEPRQPQIVYVPQPSAPVPEFVAPAAPARVTSEAALVVDNTAGQSAAADAGPGAAAGQPASAGGQTILGTRARAGMLANRATTIPQGTLIPATMETAFNSSRPGLARAIVARDVRGFDGSRVLIPRGSRLIGEYGSDIAAGQRRAMVNWVRLIRPDGVTIQIGSPATDPLGRGGIRANVNTHFFERFSGAILRSVVDVGLTLAAGTTNAGVVLLPGAASGANLLQPREIPPTLTVRAGTSISVFVARDLDFTGVGRQRQ